MANRIFATIATGAMLAAHALGAQAALPTVTVRGEDLCRSRAGAGLLVATVWGEARKALEASQIVSDPPLVAEWITFDRTQDPGATRVLEQHVRTTRSATTHAFTSLAADSLAKSGYIIADNGSTTFYAPDADVLLSESFTVSHCFHVEPPPDGRADLIGMSFRPSRERDDSKDIDGTLWLDRASGELRSLEYRYTNVGPVAERAGAGGRVEYLRLASGEWIVSRWSILMPEIGKPERFPGDAMRRVLVASPDAALKAVHVTGGEVTSVWRGDSLVYRAAGAAFSAQVVSHDSLVPAAGATVSLVGTDYASNVDVAGRARIAPVLPGRYRARARSPMMDTLGVAPVERDVEVRDGIARVDSISLPGSAELLRTACSREVVANHESLLRGIVRDSLGRAAPHAAVTVTFQADVNTTNNTLGWTEQTLGALTDDAGRWRLCGVPRKKLVTLRVTTDYGADARKLRLEEDEAFAAADRVLWRSMGFAAFEMRAAAVRGDVTPAASATVEISVFTRSGDPIPDATVELVPHSGPTRAVKTLASGHALVPAVEPGMIRVRARRIGFKAGDLSVRVAAGRNTVPIILDESRSPALDTVRVMGNKVVLARYQEFEARRQNHEATASFTEDDIEKRNPTQIWQMLTNLPSINVTDRQENGTFMVVATSRRSMITTLIGDKGNQPCFLKVMIDGVLLPEDDITGRTNLSSLPPPSSIHGVEVFAGPASIPLQYTGAGAGKWCGLIAIWTK